MYRNHPSRTVLLVLLALGVLSPSAPAAYRAGVGRADITPQGPVWLAGYAARTKPSAGVEHPLYAKALALQHDDGPPLVLVSLDILGFTRAIAEEIAEGIAADGKLPRSHVLLAATHTHTGPVVGERMILMHDLKGKEAEAVARYETKLKAGARAAAAQALKGLAPAKLSFGRGRATFAINRRVFRPGGVTFGANPDGPVLHEVPVLRVENPDGTVRAVLFGYACHCTTLGPNDYRVSPDWAGYAHDYLERAHPGATALFLTGCGGDANPEPRGSYEIARQHGLELAGAVSRVLTSKRTAIDGPLAASLERVELPLTKLPSPEELKKRLNDRNPAVQRHARKLLAVLERDGKLPKSYPCPVQVWRLGDGLTLVALGGEVVVDYALRLKRELPGGELWVAAYTNDVFAYVPSARVLIEGGYEADYNLLYYGLPGRFANETEDILIRAVREQVSRKK